MPAPKGQWMTMLQPIIDRWELCAKIGLTFSETPDGCAALAQLVTDMATKLDNEIERQNGAR
jgi:hypothetical protein